MDVKFVLENTKGQWIKMVNVDGKNVYRLTDNPQEVLTFKSWGKVCEFQNKYHQHLQDFDVNTICDGKIDKLNQDLF